MSTFRLVFADEPAAIAALPQFRTDAGKWQTCVFVGGIRYDLDIIGQDPRVLDQAAGCYDAAGKPIWKQHTGFHANLVGPALPDAGLQAHVVVPVAPIRISE